MKIYDIAILGLGTVGGGTYRVIEKEQEQIIKKEGFGINVKKVLALDYSVDIPEEKKAHSIDEIINDPDIKVVCELIGGKTIAKEFIIKCLKAGKTVVSANKELIAHSWGEIQNAAKESGAGFYFEASVGGGIPILRAVQESLQANTINSIYAIINGTTNYILSDMEDHNRDFDEVLKEAQALGYAEADPTSDIEAFDSTYKLSILSSMAFGVHIPIEKIYREGITRITGQDMQIAHELGMTIKLLAIAKKNGNEVEARVHPTMIPLSHPIASVKGVFNSIYLNGSAVGELMFYGKGAGAFPTASSVVSDIIYAINMDKQHKYADYLDSDNTDVRFSTNWVSGYYLRFSVADRPGVLAKIAGLMGKHNVGIASVIQKGTAGDDVPLIFVTYDTAEEDLNAALTEICLLDEVNEVSASIRVEQ
jgi:homoserine dehydrogenase